MVTIRPVTRALAPVDSAAAQRVSAPNYDEFQSDREVWDLLHERPDCVLRITMAHCHVPSPGEILPDGGPEALAHAVEEMRILIDSPLAHEVRNALWVYEIVSPKRPQLRQMGLGGFGQTSEIRTDATPNGSIIRNEGIRQEKADGRAKLITATNAYIGTVNLAVDDAQGELVRALEEAADARSADFIAVDEAGNRHSVWLVTDGNAIARFTRLLEVEPAAYVADGNHRSAAAAMLGKEHFLAVFFPTSRLHLEPYNRLLPANGRLIDDVLSQATEHFEVEKLGAADRFRPDAIHELGLYAGGVWYRLRARSSAFDASDAAQSIDADIVQRHIIDGILGFTDARDKRINYVGGNKDSTYLKSRVDAGEYDLALSLAPVTMDQFVAVCHQGKFMPPKSTWFDPKIRSGLVMALLD